MIYTILDRIFDRPPSGELLPNHAPDMGTEMAHDIWIDWLFYMVREEGIEKLWI